MKRPILKILIVAILLCTISELTFIFSFFQTYPDAELAANNFFTPNRILNLVFRILGASFGAIVGGTLIPFIVYLIRGRGGDFFARYFWLIIIFISALCLLAFTGNMYDFYY